MMATTTLSNCHACSIKCQNNCGLIISYNGTLLYSTHMPDLERLQTAKCTGDLYPALKKCITQFAQTHSRHAVQYCTNMAAKSTNLQGGKLRCSRRLIMMKSNCYIGVGSSDPSQGTVPFGVQGQSPRKVSDFSIFGHVLTT